MFELKKRSHFDGISISQRKKSAGIGTSFVNYLLLFLGVSRLVMGKLKQGLIFVAIFLLFYLWDMGRKAVNHPVLRISETGMLFRGWGAFPWEQIVSLWIEYDQNGPPYTYSFRVELGGKRSSMNEMTLTGLDIEPAHFKAILERYAPTHVEIAFV